MLTNPAIPGLGTSPTDFFGNLIPAALGLLLVIGVIVFVFYLLMGAIEWITAGGDKGKLESAKQRITQAIVGVVVLLSFFAILSLVECFFGIGLRGINVGLFDVSFSSSPMCSGGGGSPAPGGPGPGGPSTGSGCPCAQAGMCAPTNVTARGNDGNCWTCTQNLSNGTVQWTPASTTNCPAIVCNACQ